MLYPLTLPPHDGASVQSVDRVWNGRFPLDVVRFAHRRFDGSQSDVRTWELWRRGRAAAVLPYDPVTDSVVLIQQFRLPALAAGIDPVLVEIPAGLLDAGEDPADTARREALEEMGLTVDALVRIGDFLLTAGGSDEYAAVYAGRVTAPNADGTARHFGLAAEHEDIRLLVQPASRAIEDALAGRVPNSVAALALLWLAAKRDWLRQEWGG